MIRIFKYELEVTDSQTVRGRGLIPLSVDVQFGRPCLWATVDDTEPEMDHEIIIYGTGHTWKHNWEDLEHIGTFLVNSDNFVGHVFAVVGG